MNRFVHKLSNHFTDIKTKIQNKYIYLKEKIHNCDYSKITQNIIDYLFLVSITNNMIKNIFIHVPKNLTDVICGIFHILFFLRFIQLTH